MAFKQITGSSKRAYPSNITTHPRNMVVGDDVRLQISINGGAYVDIDQITVVQADIDGLPVGYVVRPYV